MRKWKQIYVPCEVTICVGGLHVDTLYLLKRGPMIVLASLRSTLLSNKRVLCLFYHLGLDIAVY